jgi:DNA-binding MarR family transcriptional regulator
MKTRARTAAGTAATNLIVEVFRLNGRLLAAGDALVAELGLTSARWQVLGAVALSPVAAPVAHLARSMGLNRQGVQRIANELAAEGLIAYQDNPNHSRAKLVILTRKGKAAYEAATALQLPWVNALSEGLKAQELAAARDILETLRTRLE